MSRGNYRQNIFRDKEDYQVFLQLVEDAMKRYDFELHGFCCMTNHFHMLLETGEKEIWIIMKRINQLYAAYYNNKYGLIGHLFQGRYRSCLVRDDSYFLQTSRYIHLNPVKAKLVSHPEDYPWSSYRTMIGMACLSMINTEKTLSYFRTPKKQRYREFVESTSLVKTEQALAIQQDMGENELWLPW